MSHCLSIFSLAKTKGLMKNTYKKYIASLIILSVIVKLIFLFATGAYKNPQIFEYEGAAVNMLNGHGFYYDHFNTRYYGGIAPGFSVLCYLVYKAFGHHRLLIILIQIIVTSLLVIPVSLIARRIFDERSALLAALLSALYPPLIIYSTFKLHTMTVYSFLFALFISAFFLLKESATLKRCVLAGAVAGITALFRVTTAAFFVLGLAWFYISSGEAAMRRLRALAIVTAVFFIILIPWGIRSYLVFGKPLLLQTNKWESLWFGNMPGSSGSLYSEGGVALLDRASGELPPEFFRMNEIGQGDYLKKLTIGYFKEDPRAFILRVMKKMCYFWYFSPNQGSLYPKSWMQLYKIYYLAVIFPALFSVAHGLLYLDNPRRANIALILLLFFALTAVHSLYFVEARHRWSVEALILIFAANGIITIRDALRKFTRPAGEAL